jgi:hypothetical protein
MSDVINPGQVSVEAEVYGNPDPNSTAALHTPEQLDNLTAAADQGHPPAIDVSAAAAATVFPTPTEIAVTQVPNGQVVVTPVPSGQVIPPVSPPQISDQVIGQGVWVYVDPANPAAGKKFIPPSEFLVVGPDQSIQTNASEATTVRCTITAVYDADNLWQPATYLTTRFLLVVSPPALTSYPISILGRQIVFTDDTITTQIAGAVRAITGYNTNYLVVNSSNPDDPSVPSLVVEVTPPPPPPGVFAFPQVGDTFLLDVQRQGAQDISRTNPSTTDIIIFPPPSQFQPNPDQALKSQGTVEVMKAQQPGKPIITSGTPAPTAINVNVADQATTVGLPVNVFV